jgi:hypothetical protein
MSRIKPIGERLARTKNGLSRNGWNMLGRTFLRPQKSGFHFSF